MSVAHILTEKGSSVVTARPERTLDDAIHLLAEKSIGALIVMDEAQTVVGIISERDIIRALAHQGTAVLDAPISSYMTSDVVTCERETTNEQIMQLMTEGRFRHVPVCSHGKLVGLVSIGDVVKRRLATLEAEHEALRDYTSPARNNLINTDLLSTADPGPWAGCSYSLSWSSRCQAGPVDLFGGFACRHRSPFITALTESHGDGAPLKLPAPDG
jgi:CBS domain-containing protein